jgi:hypothetical protein
MRASHWKRMAFTLAASAALSACGGGGGDPLPTDSSTDAVAKYVGSWQSACYKDSGASAELRADFTKLSSTSIGGKVKAYAYIGGSCSGPVVKTETVLSNLSLTLVGEKDLAGINSGKFDGTSDQGESKVLLGVNGNTLHIGDPDAAEDAEGYPEAFVEYALSRI